MAPQRRPREGQQQRKRGRPAPEGERDRREEIVGRPRGQHVGAEQRRRDEQQHERKLPLVEAEAPPRSEEHTSELQSLMRISYAVFCLKKKNTPTTHTKATRNPTASDTISKQSNQPAHKPT